MEWIAKQRFGERNLIFNDLQWINIAFIEDIGSHRAILIFLHSYFLQTKQKANKFLSGNPRFKIDNPSYHMFNSEFLLKKSFQFEQIFQTSRFFKIFMFTGKKTCEWQSPLQRHQERKSTFSIFSYSNENLKFNIVFHLHFLKPAKKCLTTIITAAWK